MGHDDNNVRHILTKLKSAGKQLIAFAVRLYNGCATFESGAELRQRSAFD